MHSCLLSHLARGKCNPCDTCQRHNPWSRTARGCVDGACADHAYADRAYAAREYAARAYAGRACAVDARGACAYADHACGVHGCAGRDYELVLTAEVS